MKRIILLVVILCLLLMVFAGCSNSTTARILYFWENGTHVTVEPLRSEDISLLGSKTSFSIAELSDIGASVGDIVSIRFGREVLDSFPSQITVTRWSVVERRE